MAVAGRVRDRCYGKSDSRLPLQPLRGFPRPTRPLRRTTTCANAEAAVRPGMDTRVNANPMPGDVAPETPPRTALIACGALAREVLALRDRYGWNAEVLGIPVLLHNRPDRIPPAVRQRIRQARRDYDRVIGIYGE